MNLKVCVCVFVFVYDDEKNWQKVLTTRRNVSQDSIFSKIDLNYHLFTN